jgi:hypothetical protein
MEVGFDALAKKIDRATFLRDHFDKAPYVEQGAVSNVEALFSWAKMNDLLERPKLWDGRSMEMALNHKMLRPAEYMRPGIGRTGDQIMRPDRGKITHFLREGATIVLDFLEGIDPEIAALTRCIERLTGTNTSCNVFCSWKAVPGYGSHFDTMDVFAVQIEGEKTWNLYDGRFPEATSVPGLRSTDFSPEKLNEMRGSVIKTVTMKPGDLLYIPRGVFHDALATDQASLHLSFGATHSVGFTVVQMLGAELQRDPYFRRKIPHFEDRAELDAYLKGIGQALNGALADPKFGDFLVGYLKDRAFEKVMGYRFPERDSDQYFFVTRHTPDTVQEGGRLIVKARDGAVPLDPADAPMVDWILEREAFWLSELSAAHGGRGPAGEAALKALVAGRVLYPVQV